MSTRGIYGFKYQGTYKVNYNHWDSYPSGLGVSLLHELQYYTDINKMKERFERIILIHADDDENIDPKIVETLSRYGYIDIHKLHEEYGNRYWHEWFVLLSEWQGSIKPYMEYDFPYMLDGTEYDMDMIEYFYIIDLDEETFDGIDYNLNYIFKIPLKLIKEVDDDMLLKFSKKVKFNLFKDNYKDNE